MSIGQPTLVVPRTVNGAVDPRALAEFCKGVALRLAAIEAALQLSPDETLQAQLQRLVAAPDGVVVKAAGVLRTRTITAGSGVTVKDGDGVKGPPTISAP